MVFLDYATVDLSLPARGTASYTIPYACIIVVQWLDRGFGDNSGTGATTDIFLESNTADSQAYGNQSDDKNFNINYCRTGDLIKLITGGGDQPSSLKLHIYRVPE